MIQRSLLEPLAGEVPDPPPGSSDEWYSPRWFTEPLREVFPFELDVCATRESAKVPRYFDLFADGLAQPWDAWWWCNPPYSEIAPWVERAAAAEFPGVMLLPAWTDRAWWQKWIEPFRDHHDFQVGRLVQTRFFRRFNFGFPGDPEGTSPKAKSEGPKIYPVLALFWPIAYGGYGRRRMLHRFEPRWP